MIEFPENTRNILVTGGAGFIGGAVVRRLLVSSSVKIFTLDKMGYASDLSSVQKVLSGMDHLAADRHEVLKVNLFNEEATINAVRLADPDLVLHLAAESHVDRSINSPTTFINSNIIGTFNLLQAVLFHWQSLPNNRQENFRFHHISTDEVFGSLGPKGFFSEKTPYAPSSPYSASKAASDHLASSWHHTYGLPVVITNCSNNYGPWQFPEKLIPIVILKALSNQPIPLYGDGENVRDWLFVEDHVDALLLAAIKGRVGSTYCIGGEEEKRNIEVVEHICRLLDQERPESSPHSRFILPVNDRQGHDRRYAIDPYRIKNELKWKPAHKFDEAIEITVKWYLNNLDWCKTILKRSKYDGEEIGLIK